VSLSNPEFVVMSNTTIPEDLGDGVIAMAELIGFSNGEDDFHFAQAAE
jgi:hypothetical protein